MKTSMSRTIGYSIARELFSNRGTGPTSIIWCTIGISGMWAPAIRASSGLHTPQAITTVSASIVPFDVSTRRIRPPSTPRACTSVFARTVSAPASIARSRMIVPARSESTTPTPGVWKPPRRIDSSMYGTSSLISAGVTSDTGSMPHDFADAIRRRSSSIRSSVRATSMPPHSVKTSSSSYCRTLSSVSCVISFEWSTRKMKFDACPVEPPGFGSGPLSSRTTSVQPRRARW